MAMNADTIKRYGDELYQSLVHRLIHSLIVSLISR